MTIDPQAIIRAINAADDAVAALRIASRSPRKSTGERVSGSQLEPPAPISLDLFDQAEQIHYCLTGWARIVHEETSDPLPRDDTAPIALYLRQHATRIAAQDWAADLLAELSDEAHTAEGMLGTLPKRIPLPAPCECGQQQWGYVHDGQGAMHVECVDGHAKTIDQAAGDTRALVSVRGAQRVFGIRRTTISEAVHHGHIPNHGTLDRPLVDLHELRAYLT